LAPRSVAEFYTEFMDFLQSTCEAGATLAHWDREALEEVQSVIT
jgi:hypothetical protein